MKQNTQRPLPENTTIHTEEYQSGTVYLKRIERLAELDYKQGISYEKGQEQELGDITRDLINNLTEDHFDITQITCPTHLSVMYRKPGSTLPTAQEDFDQPAGADTIVDIATAAVTQKQSQQLLDKLINRTRKQIKGK